VGCVRGECEAVGSADEAGAQWLSGGGAVKGAAARGRRWQPASRATPEQSAAGKGKRRACAVCVRRGGNTAVAACGRATAGTVWIAALRDMLVVPRGGGEKKREAQITRGVALQLGGR